MDYEALFKTCSNQKECLGVYSSERKRILDTMRSEPTKRDSELAKLNKARANHFNNITADTSVSVNLPPLFTERPIKREIPMSISPVNLNNQNLVSGIKIEDDGRITI